MAFVDWSMSGPEIANCNCDFGCPCNFNARPTTGDCEGQWLWHIAEGSFGEVPLDGLSFTVTADWPGAIHEGGGRAVCFVDDRADDVQREAIEELVRGGHGGPWGVFINTYELVAVRPLPFDVRLDGLHSSARIGDAVELELTTIKNPVSGAEVHPGAVLPEGLVCKEATFGTSTTFRVRDTVAWDHSGKYTAVAPFEYSSQ